MEHFIENCPTFKEIEKGLFTVLQQTFGEIIKQILEDMDSLIAKHRD